jgi:hypothetical protein
MTTIDTQTELDRFNESFGVVTDDETPYHLFPKAYIAFFETHKGEYHGLLTFAKSSTQAISIAKKIYFSGFVVVWKTERIHPGEWIFSDTYKLHGKNIQLYSMEMVGKAPDGEIRFVESVDNEGKVTFEDRVLDIDD